MDKLVDNLARYNLMSFKDAYSNYIQKSMYEPDGEKIAFMTQQTNYLYNVIPFGLKNAGETYRRMVNKVFKEKIRETLEVYMEDMIVKFRKDGL